MRTRNGQYLTLVLVGAIAGTALWWSSSSQAENELDTGPRVIPYTGTLTFDGRPVNGVVDVQAIARGVHPDAGAVVATLRHDGVAVRQGAFHLNLGSTGELPATLFTARDVEVALFVAPQRAPGDGAWLGGATAEEAFRSVTPHPFAYWTASASDLHVTGDANVASVSVGGITRVRTDAPLAVGTLTPQGRVDTASGSSRGVEFQRVGDSSASMVVRSGPDLDVDLSGGAGFRFKHGDDVLLEVSDQGFLPQRDVVVPNGDTLWVRGPVNLVRKEAEVSVTADNGSAVADLGLDNGRRYCVMTQMGHPDGGNRSFRVRCHIENSDGRLRLSAFNNDQNGRATTCSAQCVAW